MVYLDNAATTPLTNDMKDYLLSIMDQYGNPSSMYGLGQNTSRLISKSKKIVSEFINADIENLFFTCGGSASNTMGIKGYYQKNNCYILYSPIAHKSILKCVQSCGKTIPIDVDKNGFIIIKELERYCMNYPRSLVVIDYANSEIGSIQNIKQIIEIAHFYKCIVYLDCTASISTIPLDVKSFDIDMCGFSAHKLGALKGCGVLYKKENIDIEPLIYGSQEDGLFGGTENVFGIASLGKAIELHDYSIVSNENRNYIYNYIINNIPDSYLIGSLDNRLAHNLYICFRGIDGESLVMLLDMYDIQVSTGSACNGGNLSASSALATIGMNKEDVHSCIRISFNGKENKEELDYVCKTLKQCVYMLKNILNKENLL